MLHNTLSILGPSHVRFAHTDIGYPDFSAYRRKETQEPTAKAAENVDGRQSFTYLIAGGKSLKIFNHLLTKHCTRACYLYRNMSMNNGVLFDNWK